MPSVLPHSRSHSSFPGSQLGLQPKPFRSRSELSFHSAYRGQWDQGRRNSPTFTVCCRILLSLSYSMYVQKSLTGGGATFSFWLKKTLQIALQNLPSPDHHASATCRVFPGGKNRNFEKLRERDINISKSCVLQSSVPSRLTLHWHEHYRWSSILVLVSWAISNTILLVKMFYLKIQMFTIVKKCKHFFKKR